MERAMEHWYAIGKLPPRFNAPAIPTKTVWHVTHSLHIPSVAVMQQDVEFKVRGEVLAHRAWRYAQAWDGRPHQFCGCDYHAAEKAH